MIVPKISVIILTYNRSKLLPRAIKSVLNQKFSDFELIIVNNASTDNTDEVIRSFSDKRIIYKKNKENNTFGGRNIGIDAARGEYIVSLDDDDEFASDALEIISKKVKELSPDGIKMFWFDCVDVESGRPSGSGVEKEGYVSYKDNLCGKITGDYQIVIDRNAIGGNRYNPNFWGAMQNNFLLKLHRNNKAFYTPKVTCNLYREHGVRISNPEVSLLNNVPQIVLSMKDFIEEYGEELKVSCRKNYGRRLAFLGSYQILNGEKREGRMNVLKSLRFHFSLAHFFMFFISFILNKDQIRSVYLFLLKLVRL